MLRHARADVGARSLSPSVGLDVGWLTAPSACAPAKPRARAPGHVPGGPCASPPAPGVPGGARAGLTRGAGRGGAGAGL